MNIKCHFPIFFLLLVALLQGCNSDESTPKNQNGNYATMVAKATKLVGEQRHDSAFYFFNKAKNEEGISADQRIYALINMAEIQRLLSDFSGSEATITQALPDLAKAKLDYYPSVYTLLGITYKEQSDYKNAIKYYNLSLQHTADTLQQAILRNNIAVVYMDQMAFKKAIGSLAPLLEIPAVRFHDETHARVLDNLGYACFKMGQKEEGIKFLGRSLRLRAAIKDDFGLVSSYIHLSEAYESQNQGLSEKYASLAYQAATRISSADDRLKALAQLIKTSEGPAAKKYSLVHIRLNDSVLKIRQSAKNQFAKIRYDDAKAKQENAEIKNTNLLLVSLVLFLSMAAIFIAVIWKARHKREKQEQVHQTEKAISKKIHDVLANDVYNVMTYAKANRLESEEKKETLMRHLNSIYLTTRDIAHQTGDIDTGERYLPALIEMMQLYNDHETRITVKGLQEIPWEHVNPNRKRTIYRLIQELLVNMKKHSNASLVLFDCHVSDKKLVIGYKDNGVDFQTEKDILRKVLQNVENHIQGVGGKVIFDDVSGRVNISIPIK